MHMSARTHRCRQSHVPSLALQALRICDPQIGTLRTGKQPHVRTAMNRASASHPEGAIGG